MNPSALLAPFAAAVAAWMLTGSPVPMVLTVAVLAAGAGGIPFFRRLSARAAVPVAAAALPAILACAFQIRLFQDGRALAFRADPPDALHVAMALLWWATVAGLWSTRREHHASGPAAMLAGACGGVVMLAASAGTVLYDFGPWEVHPVSALPLALWGVRTFLPSLSFPRAAAFAIPPLALALTALALVSTTATDRLRPLFRAQTESSLEDLDAAAPALGGSGPVGDGASRRLPREADVRFRHRVLVWVQAHNPELFRAWTASPLYLRSSTLTLFDSDEVLSPLRSGRWLYDLDDGVEDHRIPLARGTATAEPDPGSLHTYYLTRESTSHLPLVGTSEVLFAAAVYEFADDWFQLSPADDIPRLRYTASAPAAPLAELRPSDLAPARTAEVPGIYLQLPPSPLSGQIAALCRGLDPSDPLGEIRRVLAARTRYSLHFSIPDGATPLGDFLFGRGRGHCEHYAAATVLMLRSLGIPARVAYGYAGGLADSGQRLIAFRDSDFHAWAEVLTPAGEWKIFDTTPRVESAAPRLPGPSALPAMVETQFHDLSEFDPSQLAGRKGFRPDLAAVVAYVSRHFFLATAISLGLLGGFWRILAGRGGPRRRSGPAAPGRSGPGRGLPAFLLEIERLAGESGLHRRPGQTWRELLARWSDRGPLPAGAEAAVAYHYATAYRAAARDPEEEGRLLEALRRGRSEAGED